MIWLFLCIFGGNACGAWAYAQELTAKPPWLLAKVETRQGLLNSRGIFAAADGIVISR
jgi:pyruvate kinase